MKKGHIDDQLTFVNDLMIMLLILLALGMVSCTVVKKNADVRSKISLDQLTNAYTKCSQQNADDCYCVPPVSLSVSPRSEKMFIIPLTEDRLEFQLKKQDTILSKKIIKGKDLCLYLPKQEKGKQNLQTFEKQPIPEFFSPVQNAYGNQLYHRDVLFYKIDNTVCIVAQSGLVYDTKHDPALHVSFMNIYTETPEDVPKGYEDHNYALIKKTKRSCSAKETLDAQFTFLLHLRPSEDKKITDVPGKGRSLFGESYAKSWEQKETLRKTLQELAKHFEEASTEIATIQTFGYEYSYYTFVESFSSVASGTQLIPQKDNTKKFLQQKYSQEEKLTDKVFIISLKPDYDFQAKENYYTINYIAGSENSKKIATLVAKQLDSLHGLYDIDGTLKREGAEQYKITAKVKEVVAIPEDTILFVNQPDFDNFYKEKETIPAIFINFLETKEGSTFFEIHSETIANSVFKGVREFLETTPEPLTKEKT